MKKLYVVETLESYERFDADNYSVITKCKTYTEALKEVRYMLADSIHYNTEAGVMITTYEDDEQVETEYFCLEEPVRTMDLNRVINKVRDLEKNKGE